MVRHVNQVPSVLWHCWFGDRRGIWPVKIFGIDLLLVTIDWSFACLIAVVVTITSITLSCNKIQNRDALVPANPDPSGKWPLKPRERDMLIGLVFFTNNVTG